MAMDLGQIEAQALLLTPQERAQLARTLIEQLESETDTDADKLWLEEARRRYAAYKAGDFETQESKDVIVRLRERLG